jgi:ADP-heptose:LPS heptosyltransferase
VVLAREQEFMALDMNIGRKIDSWVGPVLLGVLFAYSSLRAKFGGPEQPPRTATTPPRGSGSDVVEPQRVLAIKLYGLGNIAMLLPVLAAFRQRFPDAEIDFLSLDENKSLLERSGLVDNVVSLEGASYLSLGFDFVRTFFRLRRRKYDLVLDFEQFIKLSTILTFLTGAPRRFGFNTDGQGRGDLYTTRVVYRDGDHMSAVFLRLLRPLGVERCSEPLDVEIREDESRAAGALIDDGALKGRGPVVAIHVGSGPNFYKLALKRWPPKNFGQLADQLIERYGARIVFTGKGEEEAELVDIARSEMKHDSIDACDRLSIGELLALLKHADLTIANDTSVMHLASLVGTPVTAFFGATDPLQYGPRNPHDVVLYKDLYCSPCLTNYNLKISYCTNPVCIRSIGVEETLERIDGQLAAIGAVEPGVLQ